MREWEAVPSYYTGRKTLEEYRESKRVAITLARIADPEKFRARNKEWNRTHPDPKSHSDPRVQTRGLSKGKTRGEINRNSTLKSKYGFSITQYDAMYVKQGGCCAICRCPVHDKRNARRNHFSVDHDHETKVVRGLLCSRCNSVIEDARFYSVGLDYLKSAADRTAATTGNVILLRKGGGT